MTKFTKERLKALSNRENVGAICSDEIVAMARQLLAGMEQEPVGWQLKSVNGQWLGLIDEHGKNQAVREGCEVRPLYAAPQLPQPAQDYFSSLVSSARVRADKAMRKFPQPNYVLNKVAEESGEVIKAVIHYTEGREEWANVEGEIVDNLAMLIRLVTEGDQVIGFTPPESCRAAMLQGAEQSRIEMLCKVLKNAPLSPSDSQGRKKADVENDSQQFESLSRGKK